MITDLQKQQRRGLIGGTTMTAIAGVNRWETPADAYLDLTGQLEDRKTNEAMEAGKLFEAPLLAKLEMDLGVQLTRDVFIKDPGGIYCGNLDALCVSGPEPFIGEAKTTGLVGPPDAAYGDPEDSEIGENLPESVIVQTHHYFPLVDLLPNVPKIRLAIIPVLIGGVGLVRYRLRRNDELCEAIRKMGRDFWTKYVIPRVPPPDSVPSLEVLKRVRRQPNKYVPVADELVERCFEDRKKKAEAIAQSEKSDSYLLAALGDAEGGTYSGGTVTYLESKRAGYTVEPTTYRQLRRKQNKQLSKEQ